MLNLFLALSNSFFHLCAIFLFLFIRFDFLDTKQAATKLSKMIPYNAARPSPTMIIAWGVFFTLSFAVYSLCSDGDFSFLLTYAACCRAFGFFLLNLRMYASKSG